MSCLRCDHPPVGCCCAGGNQTAAAIKLKTFIAQRLRNFEASFQAGHHIFDYIKHRWEDDKVKEFSKKVTAYAKM